MSTKETGGSAFPRGSDGTWMDKSKDGMTLRDWFAGMALQGMLANQKLTGDLVDRKEAEGHVLQCWYSDSAYQFADAMIAERSK